MSSVMEHLWRRGVRRVIGPTGLSPHLQSGVLQDHFNHLPPLHTPYNSPYLPELISSSLRPLSESRRYHVTVPVQNHIRQEHPTNLKLRQCGPAQLLPLTPQRLAQSLLPLFIEACAPWSHWPPPDSQEACFLLRQLEPWPLYGWLARVNRTPVGFVLLQPDLTASLRLAKGGRNPLWQPWLAWRARRPAAAGRLLFGAVSPEWRGQGIGTQLWRQGLLTAQHQGWQSLTIGPLPVAADAVGFLEKRGAQPQQRYVLYEGEL